MHLAERGSGERSLIRTPEDCFGTFADLLANLFRDSRRSSSRHARLRRASTSRALPAAGPCESKHLDQLHERAAKLGRASITRWRVADVSVEQFAPRVGTLRNGRRNRSTGSWSRLATRAHPSIARRARPLVIDVRFAISVRRADSDAIDQGSRQGRRRSHCRY